MEVLVEVDGLLPTAALDHVEAAELGRGAAVTQHLPPVPLATCRARAGDRLGGVSYKYLKRQPGGRAKLRSSRVTASTPDRGNSGSGDRKSFSLFLVRLGRYFRYLSEKLYISVEM